MKRWIGAAALAVAAAASLSASEVASAAKIITVPQRAQPAAEFDPGSPRRIHRDTRYDRYRASDRAYDGGWTYYYGRPYYYAPAPFPLGFDFGFGW
jgi:hypothetical protein